MKHKKSALIAVLLVLAILCCTAIAAFAAETGTPGRYMISIPEDKRLVCRAEPSSDAEQIDYFSNGEIVEVLEVRNGWARTRQNGQEGWFAFRYAQLQAEYECAALLADVSSADCTAVDFDALKAAGVQGVILRFGISVNGSGIIAADMKLAEFYRDATAAGLQTGFYFSSSAVNAAEVADESDWVVAQLRGIGFAPTLPVFYRPSTNMQKALSAAENGAIAAVFCSAVETAGYQAGVYLPADWTPRNLSFDDLSAYAHWIADYGDYCNFSKTYDIWQYTASDSIAGVTGKAGLNYMFTDVSSTYVPPETTAETTEPPTTEAPTTEAPTAAPVPEETTTEPPVPTTTAPALPAHHEGAWQMIKTPTCSDYGMEGAYCTDHGELLHTRLVAPVGHTDGAWVIVKPVTETADGLAVKYCMVCGKITKEHTIPIDRGKHIHAWNNWEYIDAVNAGRLDKDSVVYRFVPSEQGTTVPSEETTAVSSPVSNTAAGKFSCTADQEKVLICNVCGKVIDRYAELPAAHIPAQSREITAADCETDGHSKTLCAICGAVIEDTVTPAYGHFVEDWTVVTPAAIGADGVRTGVCLRCGKTVTETIPAYTGTLGDVNGDGKLTSADARILLRAAARLILLDKDILIYADLDGNNVVNSADARIALRVAARLQTL